jgi:K(+)-stimulated pyrophosphate-energized sodium pump
MTELALIFGIGLLGLAFAAYLARWVLACPTGEADMARVANQIRAAAEMFFKRQSNIIGAVSAVLGGAIFLAYGLLRRGDPGDPTSALQLGVWLTASFAVGAAFAMATGRVATWISCRASVRAASGARRSLDHALRIAIRAGAVPGLFVASTSILGMAALFAAVFAYAGGFGADPAQAIKLVPSIPGMIAGYALGASFAALLAQIGGGIFSKAADLSADLAGKEVGLTEDDARNPATIADLAGDCAGDCASRSAAIFESTVVESLVAMMLGAALFRQNDALPGALSVTLFPLVIRAFGVIAALFGVMVVKTDDREDPLNALARGMYVSALLYAVGIAGAAKWLLGPYWISFCGCGVVGIIAGLSFLAVAQYYTEHRYRPVRDIADASRAGPTLTVLRGLSVGLESAMSPLLLTAAAAFGAYYLGARTQLEGGGLFGIALAVTGMLGTAGYVLAMDAFGPIMDAAAGIVEMTVARDRPDVRGRTVVLDVVGNTAKALAKTYTAATAGLAAMLLSATYLQEVRRRAAALGRPHSGAVLHLDRPEVYAGALIGGLLVVWFIARSISAVIRSSRRAIDEVRRQMKDRPVGYLPDHEACVELVSRAALGQMIVPALVAAAVPIAVGLALRSAGTEDKPLAVADAVAALIMAAAMVGVLGSLLLGNAGAAWDNAKNYIVTGAHGGRYLVDEAGARVDNPTYSAAVVGDTVGDPLKSAAGSAIHVLVKMLPVVTIVFLPFFV